MAQGDGKTYPDPTGSGEMHDVRVQVLPARYHRASETSVDVSSEKTVFDFNLQVPEQEIDRALKAESKRLLPTGGEG